MIKKKQTLKLRNEKKFNINYADGFILSQTLKKFFRYDKNSDSHGSYRVSSLYFDNPYDKALMQNISGVNQREKFRIRYYNHDLSFIRLERKIKINGKCAKQSVRLDQAEVQQIIKGENNFLLQKEDALAIEFYSKLKGQLLKPTTIVTYDREAFICDPGNVRITIDRNLRTTTNTKYFLQTNKHINISDGLAVLEVKYDEFLPDFVKMAVHLNNRPLTAYSKYAMCRSYD
ncbi:MAG TPA: polyphosphate polymerase domain-containing protein [Clostridiaceae bacterium]|nr:polyphosphate polymerase domain-containing protein [Clostridiaceae bacterium]